MIDYKNGIYAVDSDYVRPILDAIHLIEDAGEIAIVDCAHNDAWPQVEAALATMGRKPADVRWLILTHVHLDHAGGAGLFMSKLPNAKLVVHERGARHMIDPSKLYAGVEVVYGKETAKRLSVLVGADVPLLGKIPFDISLREGGDSGRPVVSESTDSPAAIEISKVIEQLLVRKKSLVGVRLGLST